MLSFSSVKPTTWSLPFGSCCRRKAILSRTSLQSLSTRHGFLGFFSKVHSPQSSMFTHLISAITPTWAVQLPVKPRESVAVTVTGTVVGLAWQVTCGGFFGLLMLKLAPQFATLCSFGPLGSVIVAFAVYVPSFSPVVSTVVVAVVALASLPPFVVHA